MGPHVAGNQLGMPWDWLPVMVRRKELLHSKISFRECDPGRQPQSPGDLVWQVQVSGLCDNEQQI